MEEKETERRAKEDEKGATPDGRTLGSSTCTTSRQYGQRKKTIVSGTKEDTNVPHSPRSGKLFKNFIVPQGPIVYGGGGPRGVIPCLFCDLLDATIIQIP